MNNSDNEYARIINFYLDGEFRTMKAMNEVNQTISNKNAPYRLR